MKRDLLVVSALLAAMLTLIYCAPASTLSEPEMVTVASHELALKQCRDRSLALDAGKADKWEAYSHCADEADKRAASRKP